MSQFDLKKLMASPFTGLYWVKTFMFGLGIFIFLIVGFAIYKAYFKKPEAAQTIRAEKGSYVTVVQNNNKKKRTLIPFVEVYAGKGIQDTDKFDAGVRAGLRFEW